VAANRNPAAVGCDPAAHGFPMCRATVSYAAEGYDALLGWVQLVGVTTPETPARSLGVDPLRIFEDLETPFAFYGLAPTLFDGPSRGDRTRPLGWLAHSFLCAAPSRPMERTVQAVVGFSWGFVLGDGDVRLVAPEPLHLDAWDRHLELLRAQFPSWDFPPRRDSS
jgi:hypothetical protein